MKERCQMANFAPLSLENEPSGNRAIAAMSGGVDSSVVAKLLMDSGYEVMGITLKLFGDDGVSDDSESSCCGSEDVQDARSVAQSLGVPHRAFNCSSMFDSEVIDRFCRSYLQGQTPNPCIDCNRYIKFRALQKRREELGFDYVATGHYARRCFDPERGRYLLKTGLDANKDQSYVLYSLTQDVLAHTLFPLGELSKPQVRQIAEEAGFVNAEKAESQDICFIPDGDYRAFIQHRTGRTLPPGRIVDVEGNVLGTHTGLDCYTIGQRKGIGVAAAHPLYVCRKDMEQNLLVVGNAEQVICTRVFVEDVNWIAVEGLTEPMAVTAKTLYRQKAVPATLIQTGSTCAELVFEQPIRACAEGQSAVFYDGDIVVGGGIISGCE